MEVHPNHDKKKKNSKTMPVAINIGGGAGSVGGIVLFGGALVTATIVSAALAFRARRSSKKSRSASPEAQTVDASDQVQFTDKDVCLSSKNQSDEVTSMKEMQSPEEKQSLDEKVECGAVVGEDEESYVDSVFKEKTALVVVEQDSCRERVDEQNENKLQTEGDGTRKSSVPIEDVTRMEEYEAMEDSMEVGKLSDEEIEATGQEDEAAMEGGFGYKVEGKDDGEETGYAAAADGMVVTGEEATDTVCAQQHHMTEKGDCGDELINQIRMSDEGQYSPENQMRDDGIIEMHNTPTSGSAVREREDNPPVSPPTPIQLMVMNKEATSTDEMQHVESIDIVATQFMNGNKETEEAQMMMITDDEPRISSREDEIRTAETRVHSDGNGVADESKEEEEEEANKVEDKAILLDKEQKRKGIQKGKGGTFLYSKLLPFSEISIVASLLLMFMLLAIATALQRYLVL